MDRMDRAVTRETSLVRAAFAFWYWFGSGHSALA
jgi:hypothetical protein